MHLEIAKQYGMKESRAQGCPRSFHFNFNCQSGFTPPPLERIFGYYVCIQIPKTNLPKLCWIELYHMRAYQQSLKKSENLASSILLLECTSMLVDIFCTKKRHISELTDGRLQQLQTACKFFLSQKCGRISPPRNEQTLPNPGLTIVLRGVSITLPLETASIRGSLTPI